MLASRAWYGFRSLLLPSKQRRRKPLAPERRVANPWNWAERKFAPETNGWLEDGSPPFRNWVERPIVQELLLLVSRMVFFGLGCEILTNYMAILLYAIFWENGHFLKTHFFLNNFWVSIPRIFFRVVWVSIFHFKLAMAQLLKNVIPAQLIGQRSKLGSIAPVSLNASKVKKPMQGGPLPVINRVIPPITGLINR